MRAGHLRSSQDNSESISLDFLDGFVAHLLGCIFVMVIDLPPEPLNCIERYNHSLLDAPNEQKYVAALYWYIRMFMYIYTYMCVCVFIYLCIYIYISSDMTLRSSMHRMRRHMLLLCTGICTNIYVYI